MISKTHEQIIAEMLADFASEINNANISDASDIAIKAKVYASLINGLYYNQKWILKQMFPQTADSPYLEMHAARKGVFRKESNKSQGILRFSRYVADVVDRIVAPENECSTKPDRDGNKVLFAPTKAITLSAGQLYIDVPAAAVYAGSSGNVAANSITEMIVPPDGFDYVINPEAFLDGADIEDLEVFRARFLDYCANPENGGNETDYEKWALEVPGVTSAKALSLNRGNGTIDIVIAGANGVPSQALIDEVQAYINSKRQVGCDPRVIAPTPVAVNVTATIEPKEGYQLNDISEKIIENIQKCINSVKIGGKVLLSDLRNAIHDSEGVYDYDVTSPVANVVLNPTDLAVVGNITFS